MHALLWRGYRHTRYFLWIEDTVKDRTVKNHKYCHHIFALPRNFHSRFSERHTRTVFSRLEIALLSTTPSPPWTFSLHTLLSYTRHQDISTTLDKPYSHLSLRPSTSYFWLRRRRLLIILSQHDWKGLIDLLSNQNFTLHHCLVFTLKLSVFWRLVTWRSGFLVLVNNAYLTFLSS